MLSTGSRVFGIFLIAAFVSGCATILPAERRASADAVAAANDFDKSFIKTPSFILTSYTRFKQSGAPLNIYIEGDGASWISCTRLSDDPTPRKPFVLELASIDSTVNVAYLARPGQYSGSGAPECDSSYWSDRRFSEEVIESMSDAISKLSGQAGTKDINLIGYSGGAAVAILVAARRDDVKSLRTIAGNLDTDAVNKYNHVSPLEDSLNPINVAGKIKNIPQRHFIGSKDKIIPRSIADSFVATEGGKGGDCITVVEGATHATGWRERWKELLSMSLAACTKRR